VKISDFEPALTEGMKIAWDEIEAILTSAESPTFGNTIEPYENGGDELGRVMAVYYVWESTMSSDAFRLIDKEMQPKLAAFHDRVLQNASLFERIRSVYEGPEFTNLTPSSSGWSGSLHGVCARWCRAQRRTQETVAEINQELAALYTQFSTTYCMTKRATSYTFARTTSTGCQTL
jgi:peptidyl-dipeptidase Dcp